jgi:hypothetical protein
VSVNASLSHFIEQKVLIAAKTLRKKSAGVWMKV